MDGGQLQVLKELGDGQAGSDRDAMGDDQWWLGYISMLEDVARLFRR